MDNIGLALSGGAARGIAHIGVLRALEEQDIPIKFISGTSVAVSYTHLTLPTT